MRTFFIIHKYCFKHILAAFLITGLLSGTKAQSSNENYIKSTEYLTENGESGGKLQSVIYYDGIGREIQEILIKGTTNNRDIIIHHSYDPVTGRKLKDFLPAPTQQYTGVFVIDAEQQTRDYYDDNFEEAVYFAERKLDAQSIGNRILEQAFPGDEWSMGSNHEVKYLYQTNSVNEIRRYSANSAWNSSKGSYDNTLIEMGYYKAGELKKIIVQDEQNVSNTKEHSIETYTDKIGRTVLTRKYATEGSETTVVAYDTYYVYDIYDNLIYIIPPLVKTTDGISQEEMAVIAHYTYDSRFRIVEKKIPDQGITYMVYDTQNRLVAVQDARQRQDGNGEWTFTKYDQLGRIVYTGLTWDSRTRKQIQEAVNSLGTNNAEYFSTGFNHDNLTVYYKADKGYPTGNFHILTINYYDKYNGLTQAEVVKPTSVEGQTIRSDANNITNSLRGLPTSTTTRVIGQWLWEHVYVFYDSKSRQVRTHKTFTLPSGEKGYTKVDSKLDFRGKPTYTKTYHKRGSINELLIQDNFGYNNQERLISHTQSINNGSAERISVNNYDLLGNLQYKEVGNKITLPALQKIDFTFNIRGWLTGINNITDDLQLRGVPPGQPMDDIFAFKIQYNELLYEGVNETAPLYNGNISQTLWKTASDNTLRGYIYEYDALSRLREARYHKPNTGVPFPGNFDEMLTYDKNGNILTLQRFAGFDHPSPFEMIDNLTYTYGQNHEAGSQYYQNHLSRVMDGTNNPSGFRNGSSGNYPDYSYDPNGNLTSDFNKGITSITYNHLNLPVQIVWNSTKKIDYLYNAAGRKIQKKVTNGTTLYTTDYLDGFQYFNGALQFFPHPEGYVKQTALGLQPTFDYVYNYTDHLGNVRLSYAKDPATGDLKILDENHYYPFGLKHQKYSGAQHKDIFPDETETDKAIQDVDPNNPVLNIYSNYDYKYNYREWQDEHALNWYAMDFRNYDPAIGRFHNPDALTEIAPDWSPYRFAFNNPVFFNDPTGLCEECDFIDFSWDGHNSDHSDFWNIMNFNWDVDINWGALADGDPEGGSIDFAGEENIADTDSDFDNSSNAENDNSDNTQYPNIEYINSNYTNSLGDPPYEYNGKNYNNKTSLYTAILVDQFAEQFGIKDIIALAAALDGTFPSLDKPFTTPGSSSKTSYASKYGSKLLPQKMPNKLPTHISGGKMRYTKVLGRFLGRVAGPIGWGLLAYDVGMSLYNTQVMYLKIITQ